ncbi:hypothetical protein [Streptomyces sp. NPDC058291]|uniref:hypothetical protein n=1 Tax=Streptomyces sp. NPDC058291 TaxID=3346427 RepID=UPI0036F17BBF
MALVTRTLSGFVRVDGKDAEDFGHDQFIHEARNLSDPNGEEAGDRILLENQDTLIPFVHDYRWGGECRVEVDMHAQLAPMGPPPGNEQNIQIWGQTRFYEGTSEDTTDLADWKNFEFNVPRFRGGGHATTWEVPLVNHVAIGADDWANVSFSLKNLTTEGD